MINSTRAAEVNSALKQLADEDENLIQNLFLDFPKLKIVHFCNTQEYNDNDYSDYFKIISINNISIEENCYYNEEGEEYIKSNKEELFDEVELLHICNTLEKLSSDHSGYENEQIVARKNYIDNKGNPKKIKNSEESDYLKAFKAYYFAVKSNKKIDDLSIFKDYPNWALYYCQDMGVILSDSDVENLFNSKGNLDVKNAYFYALISKKKLPASVEESFNKLEKKFLIKSFEKENYVSRDEEETRYYVKKYKELRAADTNL